MRTMHPQFKATFDGYDFPVEMQEAFWNYFAYGLHPGSFGTAILRNDFMRAITTFHPALTSKTLRDIGLWFLNTPLPDAFGSIESIENWVLRTDEERRDIMIEYGLRPSEFDILRGKATV